MFNPTIQKYKIFCKVNRIIHYLVRKLKIIHVFLHTFIKVSSCMWFRLSQSRRGTTSLYSACRRLSSTWTLVRSSLHTCKAIFTTTGSSYSSSERNKQSFCQITSSLFHLLTTATHSWQSNLCKKLQPG